MNTNTYIFPSNAVSEIGRCTPKRLYELLDKKVLGQEHVKRAISVAIYEHIKRAEAYAKGIVLPKANMLIIGATGSGKTHLIRSISEIGIPSIKINATQLVQHGYIGGIHVQDIAKILLAETGNNKDRASNAVVFIDEIDKLATRRNQDSEVARIGVQQDLLTIIDTGSIYQIEEESVNLDLSRVLFIFCGAFCGINEIAQFKPYGDSNQVDTEALIQYGFIPEFANRLGNIVIMETLSTQVIEQMVVKQVKNYSYYLPMTPYEQTVYIELICSEIFENKIHTTMGGRCVIPTIQRFFQEKVFAIT